MLVKLRSSDSVIRWSSVGVRMISDYSSHSDSDTTALDLYKLPSNSNQPRRVQKDYKDALEALIHMPTMGLKWSNTVAMHNAIRCLSGTLQGEGENFVESKYNECEPLQATKHVKASVGQSEEETIVLPASHIRKVPEPNKMEYIVTGPYKYPPVPISIAPKEYHCQTNTQVNEKEQLRKASHNIIERRRREKINELTQTLATLVPDCQQRDGLHPARVSNCNRTNSK